MREPDLLTAAEVAHLIGRSSATVYRWARSGYLPSTRGPGTRSELVFSKAAVLATLNGERLERLQRRGAENAE